MKNARSPPMREGLMQILSSTGLEVAGRSEINGQAAKNSIRLKRTLFLEPIIWLPFYRHYGRNNSPHWAYNAGESRVDRWLREFGNVDMPEFVEQIPFSETRGYIKQVISNQASLQTAASSAATANP